MWGKDESGSEDGVCIVDLSTFMLSSCGINMIFLYAVPVIFGGVALNDVLVSGADVILFNALLLCTLVDMTGQ